MDAILLAKQRAGIGSRVGVEVDEECTQKFGIGTSWETSGRKTDIEIGG
jgi:hypothetical protein